MSDLVIRQTKNHDVGDSVVKRCRVVHCLFKVDYGYFMELFANKKDITSGSGIYRTFEGTFELPREYSKPIGYLTEEGGSFSLRIPSKGYIVGKVIEYDDKKQAMIKGICITGKRSLVAFRQLWQLLEKSVGKLEMYLLWQDGSCYSLKLEGSKRTSDILNEYPKELVGNDLL